MLRLASRVPPLVGRCPSQQPWGCKFHSIQDTRALNVVPRRYIKIRYFNNNYDPGQKDSHHHRSSHNQSSASTNQASPSSETDNLVTHENLDPRQESSHSPDASNSGVESPSDILLDILKKNHMGTTSRRNLGARPSSADPSPTDPSPAELSAAAPLSSEYNQPKPQSGLTSLRLSNEQKAHAATGQRVESLKQAQQGQIGHLRPRLDLQKEREEAFSLNHQSLVDKCLKLQTELAELQTRKPNETESHSPTDGALQVVLDYLNGIAQGNPSGDSMSNKFRNAKDVIALIQHERSTCVGLSRKMNQLLLQNNQQKHTVSELQGTISALKGLSSVQNSEKSADSKELHESTSSLNDQLASTKNEIRFLTELLRTMSGQARGALIRRPEADNHANDFPRPAFSATGAESNTQASQTPSGTMLDSTTTQDLHLRQRIEELEGVNRFLEREFPFAVLFSKIAQRLITRADDEPELLLSQDVKTFGLLHRRKSPEVTEEALSRILQQFELHNRIVADPSVLVVYSDGAYLGGKRQRMGSGAVAPSKGVMALGGAQKGVIGGEQSSTIPESQGILLALRIAAMTASPGQRVVLFTDSLSHAEMGRGAWMCARTSLYRIWDALTALEKNGIRPELYWTPGVVMTRGLEMSHSMSREAATSLSPGEVKVVDAYGEYASFDAASKEREARDRQMKAAVKLAQVTEAEGIEFPNQTLPEGQNPPAEPPAEQSTPADPRSPSLPETVSNIKGLEIDDANTPESSDRMEDIESHRSEVQQNLIEKEYEESREWTDEEAPQMAGESADVDVEQDDYTREQRADGHEEEDALRSREKTNADLLDERENDLADGKEDDAADDEQQSVWDRHDKELTDKSKEISLDDRLDDEDFADREDISLTEREEDYVRGRQQDLIDEGTTGFGGTREDAQEEARDDQESDELVDRDEVSSAEERKEAQEEALDDQESNEPVDQDEVSSGEVREEHMDNRHEDFVGELERSLNDQVEPLDEEQQSADTGARINEDVSEQDADLTQLQQEGVPLAHEETPSSQQSEPQDADLEVKITAQDETPVDEQANAASFQTSDQTSKPEDHP